MTFGNLGAGCFPTIRYFDPLYRSAQDADLPIYFHGGTDRPPFNPYARTSVTAVVHDASDGTRVASDARDGDTGRAKDCSSAGYALR